MLTTMLVEDNVNFRKAVRDNLLFLFSSMKVIEAGDAVEAFERFAANPADLIFMDISLPGKNGIRITEEIKALKPDSVVVMLSAYNSPDYRDASLQVGANGFIDKDSGDLAARITTVVSCFHEAREKGRLKPGCLLV